MGCCGCANIDGADYEKCRCVECGAGNVGVTAGVVGFVVAVVTGVATTLVVRWFSFGDLVMIVRQTYDSL
ncbi:Hypothetical predicted protein [Octopus vulgaris]|uniref:Uncharacterized protein n=1 Tax=Octopus vulgaris TaxID=6645 RepID=A0AA36FEI2_OCTVU|nr:Hypothetical predicted protein [Octopus vulgaris]